jgi:Immunoglobulin I-set domain
LDGDKSLVIKNVLPSDEGTYICEAHNSVGQISSKAQLIVNCKYILQPPLHSNEKGSLMVRASKFKFFFLQCEIFRRYLLLVMHIEQ